MSLPAAWVDSLFAKLALAYGQRFMGLYAGLDPDDVKADWARTLSGFQQSPGAIKWGLDNLPSDHPPTAMQFRDLCRRMPYTSHLALPAPKPNPEIAAAVRGTFKRIGAKDPLEWAHRLREREQRLEKLTPFQREAWREALRMENWSPA